MYHDIEDTATFIRNAIRDIPSRYKQNEEMLRKLDQETQDLLHFIELKNLNAMEGYKAYKDLQRVRKERREIKNENELLAPIVDTLHGMKNKLSDLDHGIGKIRKVKTSQSQRRYSFRIRQDLDEIFYSKK